VRHAAVRGAVPRRADAGRGARRTAGGIDRVLGAVRMSEAARPVVALVTDAVFPYHRGGKETRYHEIARRLADRADVHVYTMKWWDEAPVRDQGGVTFHALTPLVPLYSRDRRSIRQALVFALGCLTLLGRRFDV